MGLGSVHNFFERCKRHILLERKSAIRFNNNRSLGVIQGGLYKASLRRENLHMSPPFWSLQRWDHSLVQPLHNDLKPTSVHLRRFRYQIPKVRTLAFFKLGTKPRSFYKILKIQQYIYIYNIYYLYKLRKRKPKLQNSKELTPKFIVLPTLR